MMLYPPMSELAAKAGSRYLLVNLVARRARNIAAAAQAAGDTDKVAKYAELLYDQALLIAGLPIEDPVAYAQLVCGLMQ